jgi:23S rRNA (uracil1939-C5)-methyltransferase
MVTSQLTIESIAAGGDGVGRSEGMAVFVPRTAPGDIIEATLDVRGRFARGALVRLVEASTQRVTPHCLHYERDRCGGCQLQHLSYDAQLSAKGAIVRDAVQRIGKREVAGVAVEASPSPWAYRTKLTLAMRWLGDRWIAGLHRYDNPDAVFQLQECPITDDRVLAVWRDVLAASAMRPRAKRLRGAVRLTPGGASFVLEGGTRWPAVSQFAERVGSLTAIWWEPVGARRRLVVDRRGTSTLGGDRSTRSPDAAFVQVNTEAAALLHAHVVTLTMAYSPAVVVDAYAGAGATALALADRGVTVTAIELDPDAARWTAAHLPPGSRSIVGRVEDALPAALPADVVLLNPPRAGVDERVTGTLESARPRAVVYVSCNPATLARDLQRLSRFRIVSLSSFDLFPQTSHVETVCELVPEAA